MLVAKGVRERQIRTALLARLDPLRLGYGRFLQTDPLGYDDGMNWYNYAGGDAVNMIDPSGTTAGCSDQPGSRIQDCSAREAAKEFATLHFGDDAGTGAIDALANYFAGGGSASEVEKHLKEAARGRSLFERATYTDRATGDVVVTARVSISNDNRWINVGDGFVINPNHVSRWYDVGLGGVLPAAAAIAGAAAGTVIAAPAAFGALGPAAARSTWLGVKSARFGNPVFGAPRMGSWNTGIPRLGWGKGQGAANFRFGGRDGTKVDIWVVPIPKGGF